MKICDLLVIAGGVVTVIALLVLLISMILDYFSNSVICDFEPIAYISLAFCLVGIVLVLIGCAINPNNSKDSNDYPVFVPIFIGR